jgi:hypothetical protein
VNPIEVTVAQYGVPNEHGEIMTEQDAMQLADQLRQQESMPNSMILNCRIEGDRESGKVFATFKAHIELVFDFSQSKEESFMERYNIARMRGEGGKTF